MAMRYLTTPIYYINAAPHIGTAYTTVTADAVARWHRLWGEGTFFLTGTDEHGLKIQQAAEANGVTPREWADRIAAQFQQAWAQLDISNDDFIRTTEPRHYAATTEFLQRCYDTGDIYLDRYEGLYSVADEAYVTPEEVPELERQGRKVIEMSEENYFFRLSQYEQPLLDWYEQNPNAVQPAFRRNEALGFIKQGLKDFSISRTSLSWGIPVPWDESHVTYVWFEALINYVTAAGFASDEQQFSRMWPGTHMIGKDIVRFHCVYWPAMLMSAGLEPPANIFVHGYLLVGGEKMSKTALNQIAPSDLVEDFGVDGFRYHFLRDPTFGHDSDFSYEGMVARYNADLANNLGNLLSRVATVVESKCAGIGPAPDPDSALVEAVKGSFEATAAAWSRVAPSVALEETWKLIRAANSHLEEHEPWKMEPGEDLDRIMGDALEVLRIVAVLAYPAIPRSSVAIWERIGLDGSPGDARLPDAANWGGYPGGLAVFKGDPLFPRIKA